MDQFHEILANTHKTATQVLQEFVESQKVDWPLAATNFNGLKKVKVRQFQFDGFVIKVQFNPERMFSSVSNVDKKSIAARPCFLCTENRPADF